MASVKTEKVIKTWGLGTINNLVPELLKRGASSYARNFIANQDMIELLGGRVLLGDKEVSNTPCLGLHTIQKQDGTWAMVRKNVTKLQAYDFDADSWSDIKTGLLEDEVMHFDNSFTPAGRQIWGCGEDGLFKIYPSALANPIDLTDETKNYKGKIMIEKSRMFCVGMKKDPTGIRLSRVDKDSNYVSVTGEAVGALGSVTYTGTLANDQVFGLLFTDGTQNVRDDKNGNLIGDGTGTINYATGAYSVTFSATTTNAVTADYLHEDPLNQGLADFTTSASRLAGEGNVLRQDATGTKSMLTISFDNKIFTLQDSGSWRLIISADDKDFDNDIFSSMVSCPSPNAAVNVSDGIIYIDTSEINKPKLRKLTYNDLGDKVIPKELSEVYSFEGYTFNKATMIHFNDFIIFSGASESSTVNDTTFFYNTETGGIFSAPNGYNFFVKANGRLYGGDSSTPNVYRLFDGYDDLGNSVIGEFESGNDMLDTEQLKKLKKFYIEGYQTGTAGCEVQLSFDKENWITVGEIDQNDVTAEAPEASHGSVLFGDDLYGGSDDLPQPNFFKKAFKFSTQKFERVMFRIVTSGYGYFAVTQVKFSDIRKKGSKTLRKYKKL